MLFESLMLVAAGATVGAVLAKLITRIVANSAAISIPLLSDARVDGSTLLFTVLVAVVSGLAVGMLPAFQAARAGGSTTLRGVGRTVSTGRRSRWLREALVVSEVAIACALLVVGALLLQSLNTVLQVDLGFEPSRVSAWLISTDRQFEAHEARANFYEQLAEKVLAVPAVTDVGLTDAIPLGINRQWALGVPGRIFEEGEYPSFYPHVIDRRYLRAMGVDLVDGRYFSLDDTPAKEAVVIINQSAANELFPGERAVGRALSFGEEELRIVGVVGDVHHVGAENESGKELYLPITQSGDFRTLDLVVRSDLPLESFKDSVGVAIREIDPNMPTNDVRTLEAVVDRSMSPRKFILWLLSGFAAAALLLAALGIYGVFSYAVAERTQELGIRVALGESSAGIRRLVLARTFLLAGAGVLISAIISFGTARVVGSLLFGVDARDPATFVAVAVLLLVVAVTAAWLPARRASNISAATVLRG